MNRSSKFGYGLLIALVLLTGIASFQWSKVKSIRASGSSSAMADDATNPVPRYRLQVGQELRYHGTGDFKHERGSLGSESDWQVWVIRANEDGSWRLLIRQSKKDTQTIGRRRFDDEAPVVTMSYCDLFPDGRIVANDSFPERRGPTYLFPRLPKDADEAKKGWQESDATQETRTEFGLSGDRKFDGTDWTFEGDRLNHINRIVLATRRARYVFDARLGLVKRIETKGTQDYAFHGKGTEIEELTSVEEPDAGLVKNLSEESVLYFEANRAYQDFLSRAERRPRA